MSGTLDSSLEAVRSVSDIFPSNVEELANVRELMPAIDSPESLLALRHRRKSYTKNELVYEFTRDIALIHQYTRLYKSECRVANVPEFLQAEEDHNKNSVVMVVRNGSLVVGGARITVKSPRHNVLLPLEIDSFRLDKVFPELSLRQMRYAEFSRLVLLPDYRADGILIEMFSTLCRKSIATDLDMLFAAAPLSNTRMYSKFCNQVGLIHNKTYKDVELPPYPGFEEVKDYLFCIAKGDSFPSVSNDLRYQ